MPDSWIRAPQMGQVGTVGFTHATPKYGAGFCGASWARPIMCPYVTLAPFPEFNWLNPNNSAKFFPP
jgi:hypothetical protein